MVEPQHIEGYFGERWTVYKVFEDFARVDGLPESIRAAAKEVPVNHRMSR